MMSGMSPFGGNKNSPSAAPWQRGNVPNTGTGNPLQQQMLNQGSLGGMVQYQQSQPVFQSPVNLQQQNLTSLMAANSPISMNPALTQQLNPNQLFSQVGAVTYPNPRVLNPTAFQTPQNLQATAVIQNSPTNTSAKQRVFTGTVTKVHDNFGFVDEDVFFQTTACVKGSNPIVGDRVLVEATFNPNMPFKWNATRIQVLPMSSSSGSSMRNSSNNNSNVNSKSYNSMSSGYNAVPPPSENSNGNYLPPSRNNQRANKSTTSGRSRDRSRDREREEDELERKRRREERARERDEKDKKSPLRRRSRSPKSRRRTRIVPRYMVQIPKIALHLPEVDVLEIRRRYTNLYVPSDFFCSYFRWIDAFPPHSPFALNKPCSFHIMNKDVEPVAETPNVPEVSDADYLYSAKVMLMSVPTIEDMYSKCCALAENKEKKERDSEDREFVHPTRLINFLVGLRGKNETMAIGGPWSPSLDGENPDKDPSVLIRTAIRTCRALTGIDLSNCTQWYRFVELYYRRGESTHKGKVVPARVETVVLFLPDVWSCVPTRLEWDQLQQTYRKHLERRLKSSTSTATTSAVAATAAAVAAEDSDEGNAADEKDEDVMSESKLEPTHYSQLDSKVMSVNELRNELKARSINSKGLKSQLVARLTKILKAEAEKPEDVSVELPEQMDSSMEVEEKEDKKKECEERKLDEKERAQLEKRYALPEEQHIIVHPSRTAKSGKFDCTVMSLSLLLDYRPEDTKEHSFEVSLFAELFNEMLMRDFGFNIYKALYALPDKVKDDKKKKDDEKKKDDKKDKRDDKDKKDEKDRRSDDKKETSKKSEDKKTDSSKKDEDDDEDDELEEDEGDDKKDKEKRKSSDRDRDRDRKKKERTKLITKDKNLLLSFVYFDQTHCGYIFENDIEDLIYTLGLNLSRAQVRKLVSKVITRDSLHYRKLTDKPKDEPEPTAPNVPVPEGSSETKDALDELSYGNKKLLPIFQNVPSKTADNNQSDDQSGKSQLAEGFVMYQGALVDVGKLLQQLQRSEKARVDTETYMIDLKSENNKLQEKYEKSCNSVKSLTSDLSDYKKKLQHTDESLVKMTASSKLFHSTLQTIRDKTESALTSNLYRSQDIIETKTIANDTKQDVTVKVENVKKEVHHESRWESSQSGGANPSQSEDSNKSTTNDNE